MELNLRLFTERYHDAVKQWNSSKTLWNTQTSSTGRSIHSSEQFAVHRVEQLRRRHLPSHISVKDFNNGHVQRVHARQTNRLDQMGVLGYSHGRSFPCSSNLIYEKQPIGINNQHWLSFYSGPVMTKKQAAEPTKTSTTNSSVS